MKSIHIVAGGPKRYIPALNTHHREDVCWIGVDRGVIYMQEAGIAPVRAFGDFDSITIDEREKLNKSSVHLDLFPAEKDKTDTEIAIEWAILQNPDEILLFGSTGGRLDHFLANTQLLAKYSNARIKIIDQTNEISVFLPGVHKVQMDNRFPYVSFLPVSEEVIGITLDGFKYPLLNCHIKLGSTLCISNELIHLSGTFSFENGILLMVRSTDE
ncbi:thiamine diphosphokinase [Metabacillus idriensis]|uniref:thiamine diphosphokinase n=1 Tax=Metabacillus idriensis TaxID=324768 RepID=UPI00174B20C5|nr:thiamine diphosphokinase [Metabacillus idriensis]